MNRFSIALTVRLIARAIALAGITIALASCVDDDDEARDAHDHSDGAADHSHDDSTDDTGGDTGGGGAGEEEYSQLTPDTFQQLKDMWTTQIELPKAQAETLRQVEADRNDAQLKDLIAQVDAKVNEAQTMLDRATVANGSKTLQVDLPNVLEQAGELVGRANERMTEVLQRKFGGGNTGDGG